MVVRKATGMVFTNWAGWPIERGERDKRSWEQDAERSDALDGVRRQLLRARPDLGLYRAQLSEIRSRAVLGRRILFRRRGSRAGDVARVFPGYAAAAVRRRHRDGFRRLPCDAWHQPVLRSADVLARQRADHRPERRRDAVLHLCLSEHGDADRGLFGGPDTAFRAVLAAPAVLGP